MPSLEALPPGILRRVCEYALPQGLKISFQQCHSEEDTELSWDLFIEEGNRGRIRVATARHDRQWGIYRTCWSGKMCQYESIVDEIHTSLLYVNKCIAAEARAVFFSGNIFALTISSKAHHPVSLKSPLIFGPLGLPHRLHLLRDLRRIELDIIIDETSSWAVKRQHSRIQYFTDIIQQHAEDENKRSLLKRLEIKIRLAESFNHIQWTTKNLCTARAFALEPIASILGIEEVTLSSKEQVSWFAQCLSLRMHGEGGRLKQLEWPTHIIRSRRGKDAFTRTKRVTASTWKVGLPILDWVEFAQRNGISVPPNVERKYFPKR